MWIARIKNCVHLNLLGSELGSTLDHCGDCNEFVNTIVAFSFVFVIEEIV